MKAPKILPWIAKKAGISEELALKLWRRSLSDAEHLTGTCEGSEYWGLAIERFLSLVEDEASIGHPERLVPAPPVSWMWRHQTRMSLLSLMAAQNTYHAWQNAWQQFYQPRKAA